MVKTILLLAFAVLVSSASLKHSDKILLGELIDELEKAVKSFSKETEVQTIYLTELQTGVCKHEVFCQAEQELRNKVSGLSDAKFNLFRTDKKLMGNLNKYNEHHGKNCKPVGENQNEIPLHEFLPKLLTCVKNANSKVNPSPN